MTKAHGLEQAEIVPPSDATRAGAAMRPLWERSAAELDALDANELGREATACIRQKGGYWPALAERLDAVLALKVVQLVQSQRATAQDYHQVDQLISILGRD